MTSINANKFFENLMQLELLNQTNPSSKAKYMLLAYYEAALALNLVNTKHYTELKTRLEQQILMEADNEEN